MNLLQNSLLLYSLLLVSCRLSSEKSHNGQIQQLDVVYQMDDGVTDVLHNYGILYIYPFKEKTNDDISRVEAILDKDTILLITGYFSHNFVHHLDTLKIKFVNNSNFYSISNYFCKTRKIFQNDFKIRLINNVNTYIIKSSQTYEVRTLLGNRIINVDTDSVLLNNIYYIFDPEGADFIFRSKYELYDFIEIENPVAPN